MHWRTYTSTPKRTHARAHTREDTTVAENDTHAPKFEHSRASNSLKQAPLPLHPRSILLLKSSNETRYTQTLGRVASASGSVARAEQQLRQDMMATVGATVGASSRYDARTNNFINLKADQKAGLLAPEMIPVYFSSA
eukprot:1616016-Pleurochrysis_carterae.AAC.2